MATTNSNAMASGPGMCTATAVNQPATFAAPCAERRADRDQAGEQHQ